MKKELKELLAKPRMQRICESYKLEPVAVFSSLACIFLGVYGRQGVACSKGALREPLPVPQLMHTILQGRHSKKEKMHTKYYCIHDIN